MNPGQVRYLRPRDLDAAGWLHLRTLEVQLEQASTARTRAVFEPRPGHAAPLSALHDAPALRPIEEWALEAAVVTVGPRQSLGSFAEATRRDWLTSD